MPQRQSPPPSQPATRPWWRQPLVHFLVLGAALFALDAGLDGSSEAPGEPAAVAGPEPDRRVVVDASVRADAVRRLEKTLARAPTGAEVAHELDAWVREEVLVREARRLGLDTDDPTIRTRLARKMTELLHASEVLESPTDAQLRAFLDARRATYRVATRLTVRQVFAGDDEARARAYAEALDAGTAPDALTPTPTAPPGGPVLRGRPPERLAAQLGQPFVDALDRDATGWQVLRSTLGWHAVRVEKHQRGRDLSFEDAETRLRARWMAERFDAAYEETFRGLLGSYELEGWEPDSADAPEPSE